MEWSLDSMNVPIGVSSYSVINKIQNDVLKKLPTEQDINMYIDMKDE